MLKKRFFQAIRSIAAIALLAVGFLACTGKTKAQAENNNGGNTGVEVILAQAGGQTSSINNILSLGGLSENDIKPEGFVRFVPFDEEEFGIETSEPLGEERQKVWVKKIFDKCKQLSTDGKIYRAAYAGNDPSMYENSYFERMYSRGDFTWAYPYNGKYICVIVGSLRTRNNCSFSVSENINGNA